MPSPYSRVDGLRGGIVQPLCISSPHYHSAQIYKSRTWERYLNRQHIASEPNRTSHLGAEEDDLSPGRGVARRPVKTALMTRANNATGATPAVVLFQADPRRPGAWTKPVAARQQPQPRLERLQRARIWKVFPEPRKMPRRYCVGDMALTKARPRRQCPADVNDLRTPPPPRNGPAREAKQTNDNDRDDSELQ